jgi:hypothetical protein
LTGLHQNLARDYAREFGRPSPESSTASSPAPERLPTDLPRPHLLKTSTQSIVVSTTADVDADGDGIVDDIKEKIKVRKEPRGFFADQFEVIVGLAPNGARSELFRRTGPISKRTLQAPGLKSGDKLTVTFTASLRVPERVVH